MPVPILLVVGLGVSAAWGATIAALNAGKVVVPRVADWGDEPPPVYLDPTLVDDFEKIQAALARWVAVGHRFASFTIGVPNPNERCIYFTPPTAGWKRGALSSAQMSAEWLDELDADEDSEPGDPPPEDRHIATSVNGKLKRVEIIWEPVTLIDFDKERVATHELGHALGYLHCTARLGRKHAAHRKVLLQIPKTGHIMNPNYLRGGYDMTGCEAVPA